MRLLLFVVTITSAWYATFSINTEQMYDNNAKDMQKRINARSGHDIPIQINENAIDDVLKKRGRENDFGGEKIAFNEEERRIGSGDEKEALNDDGRQENRFGSNNQVAKEVIKRKVDMKEVMSKVQKGMEAGVEITGSLTEKKFSDEFKSISRIASKMAPFFGALAPAFALIAHLLPEQPSAEMQFMKKKFAEMDAKFDQTFIKFKELKNLISKTSLHNQYSSSEQTILLLSGKLRDFLSGPTANVDTYKRSFISAYEKTYKYDGEKLLNGLTKENGVMAKNIPLTAMKFYKYNRASVQGIMKGVLNLILQAVKIELVYLKAKGNDRDYLVQKDNWDRKIGNAIRKMTDYDNMVARRWYDQSKQDIADKLVEWRGMDHKSFAKSLYAYLEAKYDWRDWAVVAYNGISGADNHYVKVCQGYVSFRKHGRNLLVTSVSRYGVILNHNVEKADLQATRTRRVKYIWPGQTFAPINADHVYKHNLKPKYRTCKYPLVAAIKTYANVQWKANSARQQVVFKHAYLLYAFGTN